METLQGLQILSKQLSLLKNIYQHHTHNVHLNNLVKLKTQGILNLISQISKLALNPCQSF